MQARLKNLLGQLPAAAAMYDTIRPQRPRTRYNLEQLARALPKAVEDVRAVGRPEISGRRLVLFATLHYWIEQACIVGLTLRAMGHEVTVAYLPYSNWERDINRFDLQRQDRYTRRVLGPLEGLVQVESLLEMGSHTSLPDALLERLQTASAYDVMYSSQTEDVDRDGALFKLRMERNRRACQAALELLAQEKPDVVVIPNGLVTELGVFYQTARFLGIPSVTYEFNDQREQIWLAQDEIVMRQNTDALWDARRNAPLSASQREKIVAFERAREGASTYGKGTRRWQDAPPEGSDVLRKALGLDDRPVVLLATNVLGDSLTLGRNIFASSMAEWIDKTVRYFAERRDVQLVIRVHPGERLIKGPSMIRVIERAAPGMPENIHVIAPAETTNTYDLMGLASLGLAYTTTVGMEMAMRGVPVIAAGRTHYRDRGFVMSPATWKDYYAMLDAVLEDPPAHRLVPEQVEAAWNYGYRFFFEFAFDFPWRLMHFWKDMQEWPLSRVLSDEGLTSFGSTFAYLAGRPIEWELRQE